MRNCAAEHSQKREGVMIYARIFIDTLAALILVAAPFWLAPAVGWLLRHT